MTALPASGYFTNPARTNAEAKTGLDDHLAFQRQQIGGSPMSELTLDNNVGGSVTPTSGQHSIDTNADASSGELSFLAQTNLQDGQLCLIRAEDDARDIVVKHGAGGTGQILLRDGVDYTFDSIGKYLLLRREGTTWVEVFRSHANLPEPETKKATTSGTTSDFTGISPNARRISVTVDGVSVSGTSRLILQVGTGGSPETSGYVGAGNAVQATDGILLNANASPLSVDAVSALVVMELMDPANNVWLITGTTYNTSGDNAFAIMCRIAFAGPLDIVRLTTQNGSDTLDAGAWTIRVQE